MKKRWISNLKLRLGSLVVAFVIWIVVMNISNPEVTRTKSVTLDVENTDVIMESGKTFDLEGISTITVSYNVRTRDEIKVKASDFRAYIDLANLYDVTGSVPVNVEVVNNKDIINSVEATKPSIVRVHTEDIQRKYFDLTTDIKGEPVEGLSVGEVTLDPAFVYLSGPVSLIGKISSVGIVIDVEGKGEDVSGTAKPVFFDANGNSIHIDDDRLIFDSEDIAYSATMLRGKSLALNFNVGGNVAAGYIYTGAESNTKSIPVIGLKSILAEIDSVEIPPTLLNIEGATQDKNITFDAAEYLPDNVSANGNTQISVRLKVEAINKKSIQMSLDDIELKGTEEVESELIYSISPEKITVVVTGLVEDLATLTIRDLSPSINVSGIEAGSYEGSLNVKVPEGFAVDSYTPFEIVARYKTDYSQPTESGSEEDTEVSVESSWETESISVTEEAEETQSE